MALENILKDTGIIIACIGGLTMGYAFADDIINSFKSAKIAKAAELEYFGRKLDKKERDKCYDNDGFKALLSKRLNEKRLGYYFDNVIGFMEPY